jgi:hopanoid biosynthesis associated RND transporter like protein HpnN
MNVKQLKKGTPASRILAWLARFVMTYRKLLLAAHALLFVASVLYTIKFLEFKTNRSDLVGADKKYHQNYMKFKKEFPTQDDLVVVVESENPEKNRQFVERLGQKLEGEPETFNNIFYKGDLQMLGSKALLFVPEKELRGLQDTLSGYLPFIRSFSSTSNLVTLFDMINGKFRTANRERDEQTEAMVRAFPALQRIVTQATSSLRRSGVPPSPGVTALFNTDGDAEQKIYITFAEGRIYLVTCQARNDQLNAAAVTRLRALVEETRAEVPGLNIGLTGEPVLEKDEMEQSKDDTMVASVLSLVLCVLIFIYGYRETGRPVKATICLVVGVGYTLGFATLAVGHLNILTVTFVPILIGLAIDFGVHLISRYEEELRQGRTEAEALTTAMVFTGQGIFSGAITTAGSFLAMGLTNFRGIQEMGIICGGGLLICLLPMLTLLPVLLLKGRQNVMDHQIADGIDRRARLENVWLTRPVATLAVCAAFSILALTQIGKVYFDYNLLNMQSRGLPAVEYEKKLIAAATKSVLFAAVTTTNLQEAADLQKRVEQLRSVASVDSITRFLSEDQTRKLETVGEIKRLLAPMRFAPADIRAADLTELSRTMYSLYGYLGAALDEVQKSDPELARQFTSLRNAVGEFRKQMLRGQERERAATANQLARFQQSLFGDMRGTFAALRDQDNRSPLRIEDLPQAIRNRFVGVTGMHLLMVYPKKNVWQREVQAEFIGELRAIFPEVTGTPVQLFEYTNLLRVSYQEAALYALGAIVLLILIQFRSVSAVFLALLPVGVGCLWLAGIMGAFDIPLNPANIMTLPLAIGIGVTNGIHILNRFAEEQTPSILARSTGKAVLVSGLTTIAGFGSLIPAKHQGIQSLGLIMSIAVGACMAAGLTLLPAVIKLLTRRKDTTQ